MKGKKAPKEGAGSEDPKAKEGAGSETPKAKEGAGSEAPKAKEGAGVGGPKAKEEDGSEASKAKAGAGSEAPKAKEGDGSEASKAKAGAGSAASESKAGAGSAAPQAKEGAGSAASESKVGAGSAASKTKKGAGSTGSKAKVGSAVPKSKEGAGSASPKTKKGVSSARQSKPGGWMKSDGLKVVDQFPSRIAAVEKVLSMEAFHRSDLSGMFQDLSNVKPPQLGFPFALMAQGNDEVPLAANSSGGEAAPGDDTVEANPEIQEMCSELRPLISRSSSDICQLRLMVQSLLTESKQEELRGTEESLGMVMSMFRRLEEIPAKEFEAWSQYHLIRSELITKFNPSCKNTTQAINDLDCKMIVHLRSTAFNLADLYMTLQSLTEEFLNKDKATAPGEERLQF